MQWTRLLELKRQLLFTPRLDFLCWEIYSKSHINNGLSNMLFKTQIWPQILQRTLYFAPGELYSLLLGAVILENYTLKATSAASLTITSTGAFKVPIGLNGLGSV